MADELITISRDGTEIGKFLESDLLLLIEQKKVLPTDHYWKEGMSEWGAVSQFIALRKEAERQARAAVDLEAVRLKKEAADREKAKKAELDAVVEAETKRRVEALTFTCNCCQSRFIKPFNPESEASDGAVEIFLGSLLIFIPIIGWLFMPFVIFRGFAKIIASRIKPPHCPNCRSSNFSRREGSDKPLFPN
jgi:ribosomal protein L37AE/L43A